MSTQFHVVCTRITIEDHPTVTTYGIAAVGETDTCRIDDISDDKETVTLLCAQLREGNLSPLHLPDVVHDFLNG